jgi:hypothetical protein
LATALPTLDVHLARSPAQVGPYIFERLLVPKQYSAIVGEKADHDAMVDAPEAGLAVSNEMRALLPFTEPWTVSPDYERVCQSLYSLGKRLDGSDGWIYMRGQCAP